MPNDKELYDQYLREQYEAEMAQPPAQGADTIEDVMHPDISVKDRAIYKNFTVDPAQGYNYMQQKYPDLEFKAGKSGDMLIKGRDEAAWKKLDPSGFDMQDISDVAYDVPAALAEGAATAAGGIGGFLLGGGIGAVPGAMAAGAAAGAGTEGLRQYIGNEMGVADDYDGGMIGTNAAFGGVSPLLMGTGAGLKQVGKAAAKKGLSGDVAKEMMKSQSGLLRKGAGKTLDYVAPRVGAFASGYEKEALQKLGKMVDSGAMNTDPSQIARNTVDELGKAMKAQKADLSGRFGQALGDLDVPVNVGKLEQPLLDLVDEYKKKALREVPDFEAQLANGVIPENSAVANYLHVQKSVKPHLKGARTLKGGEIVDYLDDLNDLTLIRKGGDTSKKSKVDQRLIAVSKQVAGNVNRNLDLTPSGKAFKAIKKEYNEFYDTEDLVQKYFKDPTKAQSTMQNLGSPKNAVRKSDVEILEKTLGVGLKDASDQMFVLSEFMKPKNASKFLGGTSATSRDIGLATAGGAGGYYLGQKTDMSPFMSAIIGAGLGRYSGSPAMMRRMAELGKKGRNVADEVNQMGPLSPARQTQVWQNLMQQER